MLVAKQKCKETSQCILVLLSSSVSKVHLDYPYDIMFLLDDTWRRPRLEPIMQVYARTSEQLKSYSVYVTPPKGDWVPLGDDVFFFEVKVVGDRGVAPVSEPGGRCSLCARCRC